MVEGRSSKTFIHIKKMMYTEVKSLHLLLDKLTKSIIFLFKCSNTSWYLISNDF